MICSEAFTCLNDSFRTIQLVEWFIQDHSVAWMIHSGFSRKIGLLLNKKLVDDSQTCTVSVRATIKANCYPLKNCSGAFSCLNDSFRTIQVLEWFIQDHSVAWMIHSGPFRCMNDSFMDMFLNVLSLTLWPWTGGEQRNAYDPYYTVRDHL
jgi:hypothetical protein